ncbi:MAG: ABC transporter ATP-binding protein [Firmicutes bacterium]|nr:ABC transporter ATP-binding protein [Bacillota bacterium]
MQNNVLLEVNNLKTYFEMKKWGFVSIGHVRAVDNVSFNLKQGEALSVVGESGCGKTTLARTILGLYRPTSGDIVYDGKSINEFSKGEIKAYRAQLGYVQQDPYGALPPFMDVRRILAEPLIINGVKSRQEQEKLIERALTDLKMTPVEDFLPKFPHMLSGGQQQRIVIARAKILGPKLIVSDEPVSMLDASVRIEILQLMRQLQEEYDLAVIYITHDLSTVRYFSERILVMYGGKIVEQGPVQEFLDNPSHPYTQALLEATSDPDPKNAETFKKVPGGEPPSLLNPPPGCRFHPRCSYMIEGLCNREEPPDFIIKENHSAACWLYR